MKKEKIKYYDRDITEQENRIMANIIILAIVIISLMLRIYARQSRQK